MLSEMRKLLRVTGGGVKFLLLLLLRSPFEAARTIVDALFLQNAFNAMSQNDSRRLIAVCSAYGIASLCLFLYNGTVWSIYAPFVTRMEGRLRGKLFAKISAFSYERIEAVSQGEWITRLNTDVQMSLSRPLHLPHAACGFVNVCVASAILWYVNPTAFWVVFVFVAAHVAVNQMLIVRAMPGLNKKCLEATAENTAELTAFITCADTAALYDGRDYLMRRFEHSSLNLRRANMRMRGRSSLGAAILPLFVMSGYVVLMMISSAWIAGGELTFGDLTAVFQYRGGMLVGSMMFVNSCVSISASMAAIKRINQTMSEKTEDSHG